MSIRDRGFAASAVLASLVLVWLVVPVSNQSVPEWYQWRGPNRDGHSPETGLLQTWPASGPPLAWKTTGAGTGYSSMSVSKGRLYTLGARPSGTVQRLLGSGTEYVIAFDVATGRKLWETENGAFFSNDRGGGPRGTPTIDGDRLYALGASGDLSCLDAATGKKIWGVNVLSSFGGSNPRWGLSESPLVFGDRVLVNAGGRGASIVAFDKRSGKVLWKSQGDEAGYSSAVVQKVGGVQQAVFFTGQRALGVDVNDGRLLWQYAPVSNQVANAATPIVRDNHVFLSSDYGTGAALLKLQPSGNGVTASEVYFTKEMRNHHSSSVLVGDHLYGFSSMILTAMRFDNGQVAWRDRSVGKGAVIYADGRLYLLGEKQVVGLAEANPAGYREHGRFTLPDSGSPSWAHPVVSGGRFYIRDQDTIYAYDVRKK